MPLTEIPMLVAMIASLLSTEVPEAVVCSAPFPIVFIKAPTPPLLAASIAPVRTHPVFYFASASQHFLCACSFTSPRFSDGLSYDHLCQPYTVLKTSSMACRPSFYNSFPPWLNLLKHSASSQPCLAPVWFQASMGVFLSPVPASLCQSLPSSPCRMQVIKLKMPPSLSSAKNQYNSPVSRSKSGYAQLSLTFLHPSIPSVWFYSRVVDFYCQNSYPGSSRRCQSFSFIAISITKTWQRHQSHMPFPDFTVYQTYITA